MEFAVGRGSGKSAARSFHELEPKGSKWHLWSWAAMAGTYLLMMFYTTLSGWTIAYMIKFAKGDFVGLNPDQVGEAFGAFVGSPGQQLLWLIITIAFGFAVCAGGLVKSVERVTKIMMVSLFVILFLLAIRALMLPGAAEGIAFLFRPNLDAVREHGFWTISYAALGQAFFSLSVGIGSMAIFGSYIKKEKKLFGESLLVGGLDTTVSLMAGTIVFACCFTFGVTPGAGPGLVFVSLPNIFNAMVGGRFWGSLFFLFFAFASVSTVIAVFENIIAFSIDITGCKRSKSCLINFLVLTPLAIPCALGFNVLSGVSLPFDGGDGFLGFEDFLVSNVLLPLGALIYLLFCVSKKGWGWNNFLKEVNTGSGINFPVALKVLYTFIAPVIVFGIFVMGILSKLGVLSL
jgi:NSS family neurotransmitter:Na+ symporter